MKIYLCTLLVLFSWLSYSAEPDDQWHGWMIGQKVKSMSQSMTAFGNPRKFFEVIKQFSEIENIHEFDQAALKRIQTEISTPGGDIEIAFFLAMNLSSHAVTSFASFELALQALNTSLPPSEVAESFYYSIARYVYDAFQHFVQPDVPAPQSLAEDHFKGVFSDLIAAKDSASIARWLKIPRISAAQVDPILNLFVENYAQITGLLSQEAQVVLLVEFIRNFSYVREAEFIQRDAIMNQIKTYLEGGSEETRIRLVEALQSWRPPAEFRPELIALAFDSNVPEVKRAARKALFFSYGGFIQPQGARTLGFHEFDEKMQIYRNFKAWLSIQRAAACRLALGR